MRNNVIGINDKLGVVEHLEALLSHAKNGEVVGLAVVAVTKDGNIIDGYADVDNDVLITIAGLRILEERIMRAYVEMPEEVF